MQLPKITLRRIAQMICGSHGMGDDFNWEAFPYRSSSKLTQFFDDIDLDYQHDGSTRLQWVEGVLGELNCQNASDPRLPSDSMVAVLGHLGDSLHFEEQRCDHRRAIEDMNRVLAREGIAVAYVDGQVCIEHLPTGAKAAKRTPQRPLNAAERARRDEIVAYLEEADEDSFTEFVVVPLFQSLGFSRVTPKGHRDKSLEYGKDLWMKYPIPSDHVLYFAAQVKVGRVHAAGRDPAGNIAGILAQLKMLFGHPVFDPDTNTNYLVDHAYLVTSGEITEQARNYLSEELSRTMQRRILFIDKADIVRMWALSKLTLPAKQPSWLGDDIPF